MVAIRIMILSALVVLGPPSWAQQGEAEPVMGQVFENALVRVLENPAALVVELRTGLRFCIPLGQASQLPAAFESPQELNPRAEPAWEALSGILRGHENPESAVAAAVRRSPVDAPMLVYVALHLFPADQAGAIVSAVVSELPPAASDAVQTAAIEAGADPVVVTSATAAGLAATTPPAEVDAGTSTPATGSGGGRPASGS